MKHLLIFLTIFCGQNVHLSGSQTSMTAWFSSLTAEKGSLESRIRDKGLYWVTVDREIKRNAFVQDLLEGRLNQPEGRGAIGRVKSLGFAENGEPYAIVDFGRGYKIGIFLAELSSINFTSRPPLTTWFSTQAPGKSSLEAKMRSKGLYWIPVAQTIKRNSYVQDILEGRLNQPEGRGAIGRVKSLGMDDNGQPYAMVDFGRGYTVGIFLDELSPIRFVASRTRGQTLADLLHLLRSGRFWH